jgi:hypothetical protein
MRRAEKWEGLIGEKSVVEEKKRIESGKETLRIHSIVAFFHSNIIHE